MWQYPVSLICYLLVAALVVFFSIKLSTFVDLLDKKTNLSGALLGGILLAATTSLPELFTSITATMLVNNNNLVLGNILGSNLFNIVLFSIIYLFFFKKMLNAKVAKSHIMVMVTIGLLYITVTIAGYVFNFYNLLWGWFNPMSILIAVIYGISVWKTPKEEESEDTIEDEKESKLTVKQIVILFIIFAVGLIAASIGITYLADWVISTYNLGATFGGALFLGVATSLPELTSTINLCKRNNINAAYGNIIGSNTFNFIILAIADLLSFNCSSTLYQFDQSAFLLLIFGAGSTIVLFLSLIVKLFAKLEDKPLNRIYFYVSGIIFLANYFAFLILSNIDLGISFAPFII